MGTEGFVIVDDKKAVSLDGEEVTAEYNGEERKVIKFDPEHRYTHGVTVHVITAGVDEGPPILCKTYDILDHFSMDDNDNEKPKLTEEAIRDFNYKLKPSVLIEAILKYVQQEDIVELIQKNRLITS